MMDFIQKGGPFMWFLIAAMVVWLPGLLMQLSRRIRARGLNQGIAVFLGTTGALGTLQGAVMITQALGGINPAATATATPMWFAGWSVGLVPSLFGLAGMLVVLVADLGLKQLALKTDAPAGPVQRTAMSGAILAGFAGITLGIHTFMEICAAAMRSDMGELMLSAVGPELAMGFTWAAGIGLVAALCSLIATGSGIGGLVRVFRTA